MSNVIKKAINTLKNDDSQMRSKTPLCAYIYTI